MSVTTVTHLNFRGDAREALAFYAEVSGGEQTLITYAQMGSPERPEEADQIVWGQVLGANGFHVMAFDVPASRPFERGENSFFLSMRGDSAEEVTQLWEKLSKGAVVVVPLGPSQWSPLYGMLVDRFGVTWVVDVAVAY